MGGSNYIYQLDRPNQSIFRVVGGRAKPATIYILIYTAYIFAFANNMNPMVLRPLYGVFYLFTAYYLILSLINFYRTSKFLKYLSLIVLLHIIYGVLLLITGTKGWINKVDPDAFLMDNIPTILPIFVFYYFGRKRIINERWFKVFMVFYMFIAVLFYLSEQRKMLEMSLLGQTDFTNNSGYIIASLLPLIAFLDKRRSIQYLSAAAIFGFALLSFKRGAILCGGLAFIFFFINSFKTSSYKGKVSALILSAIVIFLLSYYIEGLLESNDYFNERIIETMEGNSSERDNIYFFFLNYFFSAENGFNFIWGNGGYGTIKLYGAAAHNDWLEFAIDFGIIGLYIFLLFWIRVYKNIKNAKDKVCSALYMALMMCFIFNLSRSFLSMSIGNMSFASASVLGYGMGVVDYVRSTIQIKQ